MLALFEVLSFKGWLDIRDVILKRLGAVSHVFGVVYLLSLLICSFIPINVVLCVCSFLICSMLRCDVVANEL